MRIIFDRNICKKIRQVNPINSENEQGGILLGNVFQDYVVLKDLSLPSNKDKSTECSFFRNKDTAQEKINAAWESSNGENIYIGEWHTHFENTPYPSVIDHKMIKKMLSTSQMEIDFLFLMIIGYKTVWIGIQKKKKKLGKHSLYDFYKQPYQDIDNL